MGAERAAGGAGCGHLRQRRIEPVLTDRTTGRWNAVAVPERVAARAYERVERRSDGCWISTYSVASHGYSQIGWQDGGERHVVLGHRAAWVHVHGQLPLGMTLDHTCKERRCVNPGHLRMLPNYENARRTNGNDWPMGECAQGHPNTAIVECVSRDKRGNPRAGTKCAACRPLYNARYDWRKQHPGEPMPDRLLLRPEK